MIVPKDEVLLYTRGKRRRCQSRIKTKPSSLPFTRDILEADNTLPMLNYPASGEQAGLEPTGRQHVWRELSRWEGGIKKLTASYSWMGGEPGLANGTGKGSKQGRPGEEAAKDTERTNKTKQKGKTSGTVFHCGRVFSGGGVWGFVLCKQPQEGPISSREVQPKRKNKFENHSDRGRCDGLTASTNISVPPFTLADFSSSRTKKKKKKPPKPKSTERHYSPGGSSQHISCISDH